MINESIPQSFRPLSKARPIRLLSFHEDAARELQAEQGYRWRVVPAGTVYNQDQPVIGLDWQHWIVVAHADLPHEIAYSLADAFFREPVRLERQYTADNRLAAEDVSMEAPMRPEAVANEVCVPLHPGAEARYREAGVLSDG
jgi:TRAP-type uncharacterized transport system substrate-binding protein